MCGKADEMWEERKKIREEELAGISEVRAGRARRISHFSGVFQRGERLVGALEVAAH